MRFEEIVDLLRNQFPDLAFNVDEDCTPKAVIVPSKQIHETLLFLRDDEQLFFDLLSCISAIDNGPEGNTMELAYNISSIPLGHQLMVKSIISREKPQISTVSDIWRTADWHEREAFDLFGIEFSGHNDLRRILLPEDWEGYPLRKDYTEMEKYHGIKVKY